jgi:putative ABC transport system permease protein
MFWLRLIYTRLYGLLRKTRIEQEMEEEMRFHLRMRTRENIERGMRPDEAEREARRRFGNVGHIKDMGRDIKGGGFIETLLQDLRYGVHMLRTRPGFTLIAVITLALGIGANTAIFSVVNAVLLREMPYRNPDRLVLLWEQKRGSNTLNVSYPNFADWRDESKLFEEMVAYTYTGIALTTGEYPEPVMGVVASGNLFTLLGINPMLGRAFTQEDAIGEVEDPVIILSHDLWQRRFGSDVNVTGKTINMNSHTLTVIGVMPPGFEFPQQYQRGGTLLPKVDAWLPLGIDQKSREGRGSRYLTVIGRLKSGVTLEQAQAELNVIARRLEQDYPSTNKDAGVKLVELRKQVVGDVRAALLALFGAVGFVLLIACANVANMLLARSVTRQREMAIRVALGSSSKRIFQQLFTETMILSLCGGLAGLALATAGVKLLIALSTDPRIAQTRVDGRTLIFTMLVAIVTGVIFGVAPAIQASNPDLNNLIKENSRIASGGMGHHRLRNLLVVVEVALAFVLLVGAVVMIKNFLHLQSVNPGFRTENTLTAAVSIIGEGYNKPERVSGFYQELLDRLQAFPEVLSVGAVNRLPLGGSNFTNSFKIDGVPRAPGEIRVADYRVASSDYFHAMGIPILQGRVFTNQDQKDAPPVALINNAMARKYFPNLNPIGQRLVIDAGFDKAVYGKTILREIVGVVGDVRHTGLDAEARPEMYVPFQQNPQGVMIVMHTAQEPSLMISALRNAIKAIDPNQLAAEIKTMDDLRSESIGQRKFTLFLLSVFAVMALTLCFLGVYGLIAYSVTQRSHEIGIRMALGAKPNYIGRMILRQGLKPVMIGMALGIGVVIALNRMVVSLLYGVTVYDPATILICMLILITAGVMACLIPAAKASRLDPVITLREE